MIKGIFHPGSGLGNQLHRYVGTKVISLEQGGGHTMIGQYFFKGKNLFNLDLIPDYSRYNIQYPAGKIVLPSTEAYQDVHDGEFQAENDFYPYIDGVREWLQTDSWNMCDNECVINFRGGEYVGVPELFLPKEYWDKAINEMKAIKPDMKFVVHTDDEATAKVFFPEYSIVSDIGVNWRAIRHAEYLILSNSSFAILPAYMNERAKKILAPKYWARYNTKEWINPDNATYSKFKYIHHEEN